MSDQTAEIAPEAAQPEPQDSTDWKSEARKWEARAKANRADSDRLKELESKYEEASKRLEESLGKLSDYEAKEQRTALVSKVSEETGVPAEAVDSLSGSTLEELTEQANKIKPFIGANRVVIPNVGDAPNKTITPESEFVGNLFGQGD